MRGFSRMFIRNPGILLFALLAFNSSFAQEWELIPSPNPNSYENVFWALGGSSPDNAWAVGSYNTSNIPLRKMNFTAHWDGSEWNYVSAPNLSETYNRLTGVAVISDNEAWAVGEHNPYGPTQMTILHWDGDQWSDYGAPFIDGGASLHAMEMIGPEDIWAVGSKLYRGITMHWNGSEWEYMEPPPVGDRFNRFWAIDASSPDNVWAAGRWGDDYGHFMPLIMRWDGSSWIHVPGPEGYSMVINGISVISPDNVWMVGITYDAVPRFLHWDGQSVEPVESPGGGRSITAVGPDDLWSVSGNSMVHWSGSQWESEASPSQAYGYAVDVLPGGDMWAVGVRYDGEFPMSMTMRYIIPTAIGDSDVSLPSGFELAQNYPNPFNASTRIRFSLASRSDVSLEVFDIMGRRISILSSGVYEPGEYDVVWDAAGQSSGIYFYRLSAGGQGVQKRMVLVK